MEADKRDKKTVKKMNKCHICKKKNIINITCCKCNKICCIKHRCPESHNCEYEHNKDFRIGVKITPLKIQAI